MRRRRDLLQRIQTRRDIDRENLRSRSLQLFQAGHLPGRGDNSVSSLQACRASSRPNPVEQPVMNQTRGAIFRELD